MGDVLKAIILGIIQGLTEFLPVSSSGHLEIGQEILNFDLGEEDLLFTIVVHFATVLSTIVVFRKEILDLIKGAFQFKWNQETEYIAKILISMIPVAIIGVFFKDQVEAFFKDQITLVGAMLLVTAFLLYLTKHAKAAQAGVEGKSTSFKDAFIIGIAQAVAVMPGISRSGSTIATGLLLGVDKNKIAKFSFLMVLLPIIGITILDVKDLVETGANTASYGPLLAGFFGAFLSGWAACTWMLDIVKKGKLIYFAIYCAIVGTIAIAYGLLL